MTNSNSNKHKVTDSNSKLDALDRELIREKIKNPAVKNVYLAKKYGKSAHIIGKRLKKPKVAGAIEDAQKTALDILLESQRDSAKYLGSVVNSKKEETRDRISASKEILKGVLSEKVDINLPQLPEVIEIIDVGTGKK